MKIILYHTVFCLFLACSTNRSTVNEVPSSQKLSSLPDPTISLLKERPYQLDIPTEYQAGTPAPLLLVLHPYGGSGAGFARQFSLAKKRGWILVYPDGLQDQNQNGFWNATDACCDFYGIGVDDFTYLKTVLEDVRARYTVDPKRIYSIGYSNGAFMAHRLACDLPEITAIVAIAGSGFPSPSQCKPKTLVSVLQIHGDQDQVVPFHGGELLGRFPKKGKIPSAYDSVAFWAKQNGCSSEITKGETIDVDASIPGNETTPSRFSNCQSQTRVELWPVSDGKHFLPFQKGVIERMFTFLEKSSP